MGWRFKNWALSVTEPWREERAAHDLAWRIFAQAHNAAGKRPQCWYPGMEEEKGLELDPKGKVTMYEFPPGSGQEPLDPDYLVDLQDYSSVEGYPKEKK